MSKFVWKEDGPWLGFALLGIVVGTTLSVLLVQSSTPKWLVLIPATTGFLFLCGGLYVVYRHVFARWCFRCNRPRERWNHFWFFCPKCKSGRWYEDPDSNDMDVDYKNYKEPFYHQQNRADDKETTEEEISIEPFSGTHGGVRYHIDCLTADTIDIWCDLSDDEKILSPYYYLRHVPNSSSDTTYRTFKEDIDALIDMGVEYIDIGSMDDTVAVGFPRTKKFKDRLFLLSAAEYVVRLKKNVLIDVC